MTSFMAADRQSLDLDSALARRHRRNAERFATPACHRAHPASNGRPPRGGFISVSHTKPVRLPGSASMRGERSSRSPRPMARTR